MAYFKVLTYNLPERLRKTMKNELSGAYDLNVTLQRKPASSWLCTQ